MRSEPDRGFNPFHQGGKVEVGRRVVRGIPTQDHESLNPALGDRLSQLAREFLRRDSRVVL